MIYFRMKFPAHLGPLSPTTIQNNSTRRRNCATQLWRNTSQTDGKCSESSNPPSWTKSCVSTEHVQYWFCNPTRCSSLPATSFTNRNTLLCVSANGPFCTRLPKSTSRSFISGKRGSRPVGAGAAVNVDNVPATIRLAIIKINIAMIGER